MRAKDHQAAYQGKTILITGRAGAIGSNLARALGELGAKLVLVLDAPSSASHRTCRPWLTSWSWKAVFRPAISLGRR
jgi:NAD(P)-dependent dehydrogenase (short-subunit alcohol dehydrogenase family)